MSKLNPNFKAIKNQRSQCRVVTFQWDIENLNVDIQDDQLLSSATPLDVSSRISACSFTKTLDEPAGSFSFTLENDRDWKEIIRPGQWCLLYMSHDSDLLLPGDVLEANVADLLKIRKKLRCIGYIDRISTDASVQENGALDVVYTVTGRDFGVVYADTTIWHNFFESEQAVLKAYETYLNIPDIETIDELVRVIHHLIYAPLTLGFKPEQKLTTLGNQWLMPSSLFKALDLTSNGNRPTFYGNIGHLLDELSPTTAGRPTDSPVAFLNGNAWDILKGLSIQPFHEMFTELNNAGEPRIIFRPIPWKLNDQGYTVIRDNVLSLQDLSNEPSTDVRIGALDVQSFSLGEDNHSRYNHFFTYLATAHFSTYSSASVLLRSSTETPGVGGLAGLRAGIPPRRQFPFGNTASIKRHGFRPMHVQVNTLTELNEKRDAAPRERLLVQYNEMMLDYYRDSVFFENGSIEIIGNSDVRIGKTLTFATDVPYNGDKIFYIEGYEDKYILESKGVGDWVQTIQVTRGANKQILSGKVDPFTRVQQFLQTGEFTGDE